MIKKQEGPGAEDDGMKKRIKGEEGPGAENSGMKKRIKSEDKHNRKSFTLGQQKTKLEDIISAFYKSV